MVVVLCEVNDGDVNYEVIDKYDFVVCIAFLDRQIYLVETDYGGKISLYAVND